AKSAVVIHPAPMLSGVIRTIEPAFLCFDDGVDPIGVRARNRDADFSKNPLRQSISLETFPRHAIIFRAIQTAARSAARKKPRLPARLPEGREDNIRVMRIKHNVDAAGIFILAQNFRPCLAPVSRAKNSALLIWAECVRTRCDHNHVSISWI